MMLRNCIICDFCFETLNKRKIFCSKSCKQKNSYRKNRVERCNKEKEKRAEIKINDPKKYEQILQKTRARNNIYYKNNLEYKANQIKKTQQRRKDKPLECARVRRRYYLKVEKIKNSLPQNRIQRQEKWAERYYSDKLFKIKEILKSRLRRILKQKNVRKPLAFRKAFGISFEEFKKYIENQFVKGMNWNNYGKWHLDHIVPLSFFNLSNLEEYKKANHYSNFQPLWAKENLKKSNKLNYERRNYA